VDHTTLCPSCFESTGAADPCPHCGYTSNAPSSHIFLKPGTVLFGKYMVGRVLGQGGFGITYLGWDMNLDVKLAIKEFFPHGLVNREPGESYIVSFTGTASDEYSYGIERFLDEAKTLARFEDHPNIVSVRDFFRENNTAYMVMGFVEGITLEKHLENQGGKIPFDRAVEILMPVMDALREVHEVGFLHRDISPDNMVISNKGRVVLIDFGAARQAMGDKSRSMSVIMKAGYSPIEQYQSKGKQGPWTDIYAVAATFYHAITGQAPLEAIDRMAQDDLIPPSQLKITIAHYQEQTLLKALAVGAEGRFQTVESFQASLAIVKPEKTVTQQASDNKKIVAPAVIKGSAREGAALYYIDYAKGTMPLERLPIGTRVADPTWVWVHRTGSNYTGSGEKKPVIWVVVDKDHYEGLPSHVTLLAEELIGKYTFDNSKRWLGLISGRNHWGESGTGSATRGLRPWLNSSGIHAGEGFYQAFSDRFKGAILTTTLPSREWKNGTTYSTNDHVFIPSTTELGYSAHKRTYPIGMVYPYFSGEGNAKRLARLGDEARSYWLRSPASFRGNIVRLVYSAGGFLYLVGGLADFGDGGVRPALNLKSGILVSEIMD